MYKLLIVDDEKDFSIDLSLHGITISGICKDTHEAYDTIIAECPDIVIIGINTPDLSGLELIQMTKTAKLSIEFIILSRYESFNIAKAAMGYGVKHYIIKPYNKQELTEAILDCANTCQEKIEKRLDILNSNLFNTSDEHLNKIIWQKYFTLLSSVKKVDMVKNQLIKLLLSVGNKKIYEITDAKLSEYIIAINKCNDIPRLLHNAENIMAILFDVKPSSRYNDCVERVIEYVNIHLSDSNLSLKWISENYLYMNADYVSKKFVRQTGCKFSAWLTDVRIQEAKKLIQKHSLVSPYSIAEMVGFGNNPQYFSQIFKKNTGMTPSAYMKQFN